MSPSQISIHAPRMGSDSCSMLMVLLLLISIHAPRMGSDATTLAVEPAPVQFQSTLPGWGATGTRYNTAYSLLFQSTLPGWGATHCGIRGCRPVVISIHAPRMGSDLKNIYETGELQEISIHAPRMGSDRARARRPQLMAGYFNPRSPDGERPRPGRTRPGRIPYFNPRSPDGERLLRS